MRNGGNKNTCERPGNKAGKKTKPYVKLSLLAQRNHKKKFLSILPKQTKKPEILVLNVCTSEKKVQAELWTTDISHEPFASAHHYSCVALPETVLG